MSKFQDILKKYIPLNEGLIVSFDVKRLQSKLYELFGDNIIDCIVDFSKEKYASSKSKFGTALSLDVLFKNSMLGEDREKLEDVLNVFGYYISSEKEKSKLFVIEPKFSIQFDHKKWNISRLYHVTPKKNIPKIMRQGLIAKKPQTTFDHPDDRIYFFFPKSKEILDKWVGILARNKEMKKEEMSIIAIEPKTYQSFYLDDTATVDNTMIAVYTLNPIPSTQLIIQ